MKIVDSGFPPVSIYFLMSSSHAGNIYIICFAYVQELVPTHILSKHNISISNKLNKDNILNWISVSNPIFMHNIILITSWFPSEFTE